MGNSRALLTAAPLVPSLVGSLYRCSVHCLEGQSRFASKYHGHLHMEVGWPASPWLCLCRWCTTTELSAHMIWPATPHPSQRQSNGTKGIPHPSHRHLPTPPAHLRRGSRQHPWGPHQGEGGHLVHPWGGPGREHQARWAQSCGSGQCPGPQSEPV